MKELNLTTRSTEDRLEMLSCPSAASTVQTDLASRLVTSSVKSLISSSELVKGSNDNLCLTKAVADLKEFFI